MMNCRDMTKLISDSMERPISWRQRMELWMHTMMCGLCRAFRANIVTLRKLARQIGDDTGESDPLSPNAKERVRSAMKRAEDDLAP